MVIGKPLPFVRAFVEAVDKAMVAHSPGPRLSTLHRAWLAFCLTALVVTNAICWARFERASLGTYALAALSWMFRHAKIPWEPLLVASVRVMLESDGITGGSLVIDDTDQRRSKTATPLAHLYNLRDQERGRYIWGQRLVFLLLVTPTITIPMGFACYQPAPELRAWDQEDKRRKQQRPPNPPNPTYPTKPALALRVLRQCKAHHPERRVHCMVADALYGASTLVDAASAIFGGVQVISPLRSHQKGRLYKREQYVADYLTTHPGTPQKIRIRGGEEIAVLVGSARMDVGAHHTKRFIMALKDEGEDSYRYLLALDLTWRTLDIVQGHTLRWLVEVFVQDWKSHAGWHQLTKQPGEAGARQRVLLSLLGDHGLVLHPDQLAQLKNHLPAYTVGSLRANVQVECLVDVIQELVSSEDSQGQLHRFTQALHEMFALGRSKKHLVQCQLGRLEPTPYLKYRAEEVLRNMPALST